MNRRRPFATGRVGLSPFSTLILAGCCCARTPCLEPLGAEPTGLASRAPIAPLLGVEAAEAELTSLLARDPSTPGARDVALRLLGRLVEEGTLRPALEAIARRGLAGTADAERRLAHVGEVHDMIAAALCLHGHLPRCAGMQYEPFDAVARRFRDRLAPTAGRWPVDDPRFVAQMESLQDARFDAAATVRVLVDGPASWAERERLVSGARRTLHVLTWALYDDPTGWEAARWFVERARAGVAVRVLVDERVSGRRLHDPPTRWLEEQTGAARAAGTPLPLEVVRWRDETRPFDGQHRKLLIADGREAVLGGMNFGDLYSHRNPKEARRWRDTDVLVTGAAVVQAEQLFARLWNQQGERRGLASSRVGPVEAPMPSADPPLRVAIVDSTPGDADRILLSLVAAIGAARTSIDIENAYFIRMAPLDEAIRGALARKVRVRVLTNSPESLDEPTLSYGIVETIVALAEAGVEAYVKRGDTLHSKFVVVDGVLSHVGSYNFHPRSHRLEGEVAANMLGAEPARALTAAFERDIAGALRVHTRSDLERPTDPFARLAWSWFSDLL